MLYHQGSMSGEKWNEIFINIDLISYSSFFIPVTVETLWPFPSQIPWLVSSLDSSSFPRLATCLTFRMCRSVRSQWTVGYFSVDSFTLLFFYNVCNKITWIALMNDNYSPCRSRSGVRGLPTSLCDDARRSSVGRSLLLHVTLPRPRQSGITTTLFN